MDADRRGAATLVRDEPHARLLLVPSVLQEAARFRAHQCDAFGDLDATCVSIIFDQRVGNVKGRGLRGGDEPKST